jgi:ankyrin repeat protein
VEEPTKLADTSMVVPHHVCVILHRRLADQCRQHQNVHTKPFECEKCQQTFASRSDLQRHDQARHRVSYTKYPCQVEGCDFKATRKDNLNIHILKKHDIRITKSRHRVSSKKPKPETKAISFEETSSTDVVGVVVSSSTIFQAANAGDIAKLESAFNFGADPNGQGDDGSTPLHCAARAGQLEAVTYILGLDAAHKSLAICNEKGRVPLHEAALSLNPEVFRELLTHHMRTNGRLWETTWDCVVKTDRVELAEIYLSYNAVFIKDKGGAGITTSKRSRINIYDLFATTVKHGSLAIMRLLLSEPDVQERISWDNDLIHRATKSGKPEVLEELLSSTKIRSNAVIWSDQGTALHGVAARGSLSIASVLLSCDTVDANSYDAYDRTPLHRAAAAGHLSVVQLLLDHRNVDVVHQDKDGRTALHHSIIVGHLPTATLLFQYQKGFINTKDKVAALALTVLNGRVAMLKEFFFRRDTDESAAVHSHHIVRSAAFSGQWEIVKVLLEHEKCPNLVENMYTQAETMANCPTDRLKIVKQLLHRHSDLLNLTDKTGETLLHKAVKNRDAAMVDLLLSYDEVAVNWKSKSANTAIHNAARQGNIDVLKHLLNHNGLEVNASDDDGWTALHLATACGNTDTVKLLLAHPHLDITGRTRNGAFMGDVYFPGKKSAVELASEKGNDEIYGLLVAAGAVDKPLFKAGFYSIKTLSEARLRTRSKKRARESEDNQLHLAAEKSIEG